MVGWIVALFAVTQSSHGVGANTADALFFRRFGVEELPLMILLSGPAVMVMTLLHATGVAARGVRGWLWLSTSGGAVWLILEWAAINLESSTIYPVIWISTQVLIFVTLTVMWNAAGAACTTRQAKRLFPIFATAGVAGGVIGNLLVGPMANLFGTQNLLVVQGGLLVGSTILLLGSRRFFSEEERARSVRSEMADAFNAVRSSRLLQLAAAVAFAFFAVFFLVVFPFSEAVAASFGTEAEIATFLGIFSSIATAATFLFSLLITNRLFARLGIVVSLMLVPLVYVAGFSLWLVAFGLVTAALFRGLQWVAVNAIQGTAFSALFNVLSGRRRSSVMAFMTAVPAQLGTIAAGLILIAGESLSRSAQLAMGLVISLAALALVIAMRPAYVTAVVSAVKKGLVGVFDLPQTGLVMPVDGETTRILRSHLDDPRPEARAIALTGLANLEDGVEAGQLERLFEDESPLVRSAAFDSVCLLEPERISRYVTIALADDDPRVRLNALRYLTPDSIPDLEAVASSALGDSDPRVRATSAFLLGDAHGQREVESMISGENPEAIAAVLDELGRFPRRLKVDPAQFLDHPDPEVRTAAATAYAAAGEEIRRLLPGLDDPSVRVREASAEGLSTTPEGRELLLGVLKEGSVAATDAALQALTPVDHLSWEFTEWAGREARRASHLESARRGIATMQSSPLQEYLSRTLEGRARRMVHWVLVAMTTEETREIMPIVEGGVRSSDPETKAQAIEALETVGAKTVLSVLLPLLEADGEMGARPGREVLRDLSTDFDPWLRALSIRCLAEEIESDLEHLARASSEDESDLVRQAMPSFITMPTEHMDTLNQMDRVLVLQRVPMFSEIDPEDLYLIAEATAEVRFDPSERIYSDGETGDEMLVIVEGEAIVSKARNGSRDVIETYRTGDHVGELSLLQGGLRSADVDAGDDGLHGLVLSKGDILSILEERPAVALGMLGTLAKRLVEQT